MSEDPQSPADTLERRARLAKARYAAGLGWDIFILIVGLIVAVVGFGAAAWIDVGDSAIRLADALLWAGMGISGLLISAIGIGAITVICALISDPP